MILKIVHDDLLEYNIKLNTINEKRIENAVYDGIRETNRRYSYYFLLKKNIHDDMPDIEEYFQGYYRMITRVFFFQDSKHPRYNFFLVKIITHNKYDLDEVIDRINSPQSLSPYVLVEKTISFSHLNDFNGEALSFLLAADDVNID